MLHPHVIGRGTPFTNYIWYTVDSKGSNLKWKWMKQNEKKTRKKTKRKENQSSEEKKEKIICTPSTSQNGHTEINNEGLDIDVIINT